MIAPPIPQNEQERLADLRALEILDTPPEERFDRLVQLASELFDVPIAYIAMVDADRQWFKAKCGLTVDQTGREVSFCGHAICQNEPLVVPDTTHDARFCENPLVQGEPHLRFYIGQSIRGPGGHNVGTFCIADTRPRDVDARQLMLLKRLARIAEQQLNMLGLIRTQRELLDARRRLAETQDRLADELYEAACYVQSLLPQPLRTGPVRTDFRYVASSELGGDLLGYHWLSGEGLAERSQLAIYVLDACGHGVGASLLSVSAWNALRRQTLPRVDFTQPGKVLTALNDSFPIDSNDGKFLTAWYGVYEPASRTLRYATAGHPPALYFAPSAHEPIELYTANMLLGLSPGQAFTIGERQIEPESRLYIFSDGTYEIQGDSGSQLGLKRFGDLLAEIQSHESGRLDTILRRLQDFNGADEFKDDISLLELVFARSEISG